MARCGGGKIINIASVGAFLGQPFAPNSAASKGGLISLTKALAVEGAKDNVQVNAILPRMILTEMTGPEQQVAPQFDSMVKSRTPAKRWGDLEDFKGVAIFLASDASAFVTGGSEWSMGAIRCLCTRRESLSARMTVRWCSLIASHG